ncbi:kinase-like domain-containing protein [Mycena olivaceomarginata]|nr:kinase-like domain-containing protein [Mycena olivaceomarginata]
MARARVHADVNAHLGKSWYDYENFHIDWKDPDRYEIVKRMGGGKYSEVFEGIDMVNNDRCVIKVLKPVAAKKIKREIKVLRNLTGGPNIVELLDVVRDPSARYHSLVMVRNAPSGSTCGKTTFVTGICRQCRVAASVPYIDRIRCKVVHIPALGGPLACPCTWDYAPGCQASASIHKLGNVLVLTKRRQANVMIDYQKRKLRLIDWGLAEFYHTETDYHIRVGSRYYKAPELLVGYKRYDYSLDMWSVGCMFASMIFRKEHFFRGSDNDDQLLKILRTLGTERFDAYLKTHNIHFETDVDNLLVNYPKQPWSRFVTAENRHLGSVADAVDFLDKLLRYDHQERLTAKEAEAHPYFNSVRLETISTEGDSVSDSGFAST